MGLILENFPPFRSSDQHMHQISIHRPCGCLLLCCWSVVYIPWLYFSFLNPLLIYFAWNEGVALLCASLAMWVFGFVTAGDTCKVGVYFNFWLFYSTLIFLYFTQRISRRLFQSVEPSERVLLTQMFNWLGIDHFKQE